jgi:murein DD-endopeptidase MepM/ murein hydrolase activator NlpD
VVENIAAVMARVAHLREATMPAQPGFAQVLHQRLAGATAAPVASGPPMRGASRAELLAPMFAAAAAAAAPATAAPVAQGAVSFLAMPVEGRLTSRFGPRTHPITGQLRPHNGIDIAAPTGMSIRAAAGGTVSFAGPRGGYGNTVVVDHPDGTQTLYAHAHTIGVRTGDSISPGQAIATVGSTGQSTAPHLHFELRRQGEPVDPAPYLGL